ncbi:MAG: hypothetical protein KJ000_10640 [Pirellulaceae bacterium]|nr:hypothetical protein [Pirellulaceae bacterium]
MSSFSCPHYDDEHDTCQRIGDLCVPGRPGCVLFNNSTFAVPWQQRLEAKRREREEELADKGNEAARPPWST